MKTPARHISHRRDLFAMIAILPLTVFGGIAGCGGGGSGGSGSPTASTPTPTATASPLLAPTVALTADREELLRGQSAVLQWNARNAAAVTESNFGASGVSGTATVTPTQTTAYTLTVRDVHGQTATGTVTVRVAAVSVAVTPAATTMNVSQSVPLVAQVGGASDTGVSWTVLETNGGTITPDGVYTAPPVAGTYHVRAVTTADTNVHADAEVRVRAAAGTVSVH